MTQAYSVPVLMYHHVSPSAGMITTSPANFESQIEGLAKHGYRALSTSEFGAFMAGEPVPPKSILITFDDGYLDNWVYAHPVLERYGMKATLFVVTGLIGEGPVRPYAGQSASLPETPTHKVAKEYMFSDEPDRVMLRWSEIQAMQEAGTFEFHSHTHTHTRWDLQCATAQQKCERMQGELSQSRATLVKHLGSVSDHFCWPQGYVDEDYLRLAHEAGFRHLYTTDAYGQNLPGGRIDHIYRFAVRNRPFPWLAQRTWLAAHPWVGPLYNRWKAWNRARRKKQ